MITFELIALCFFFGVPALIISAIAEGWSILACYATFFILPLFVVLVVAIRMFEEDDLTGIAFVTYVISAVLWAINVNVWHVGIPEHYVVEKKAIAEAKAKWRYTQEDAGGGCILHKRFPPNADSYDLKFVECGQTTTTYSTYSCGTAKAPKTCESALTMTKK